MCWPYWTESDKMAKQLRLSSRSSSSKSSLAFKSRWQDVEDSVRNFFGDLFCFFDRELSNWKRLPSFRAWDLKRRIAFWYLTAWRLGESMTSWPQMGTPTLVTLMALAVVTNAHVPPTACKSPRHSLSTKTESDQAQGRVFNLLWLRCHRWIQSDIRRREFWVAFRVRLKQSKHVPIINNIKYSSFPSLLNGNDWDSILFRLF